LFLLPKEIFSKNPESKLIMTLIEIDNNHGNNQQMSTTKCFRLQNRMQEDYIMPRVFSMKLKILPEFRWPPFRKLWI
jgi:hypothetical protein